MLDVKTKPADTLVVGSTTTQRQNIMSARHEDRRQPMPVYPGSETSNRYERVERRTGPGGLITLLIDGFPVIQPSTDHRGADVVNTLRRQHALNEITKREL